MLLSPCLTRVTVKSVLFCTASSCLRTSQSTSDSPHHTILSTIPKASISSIKGRRNYMEDEYVEAEGERFKLLAVYDGHGGKDVSKHMKTHFFKAFVDSLDVNSSSDVPSALKAALASVDHDIITGPLRKQLHKQGSTSCVLYLEKHAASPGSGSVLRSVISANVGDSRAVLARGSKAVDLTRDHKPDDPLERQRVEGLGGSVTWHGRRDAAGRPIESTGVFRVNRNLAMSRAMGDGYLRPYVTSEPDCLQLPLTAEDEFVIVASDGLWDVVSSQECVTMIHQIMADYAIVPREVASFSAAERKTFTALHEAKLRDIRSQMASIITAVAMRRGSTDNITIMIQWLREN